jgi:hypothetical protein
MSLLNASHNLAIQRASAFVGSLHSVVIAIPVRTPCTETGCGPDTMLGGSLLPNCSVCGGSGYLDTTMMSHFTARVRWWDSPSAAFVLSTGMMTDEVGKFTVVLPISAMRLADRARTAQGAYLLIDGRRARMLPFSPNHVIGSTSVELPCELEKEIVR